MNYGVSGLVRLGPLHLIQPTAQSRLYFNVGGNGGMRETKPSTGTVTGTWLLVSISYLKHLHSFGLQHRLRK